MWTQDELAAAREAALSHFAGSTEASVVASARSASAGVALVKLPRGGEASLVIVDLSDSKHPSFVAHAQVLQDEAEVQTFGAVGAVKELPPRFNYAAFRLNDWPAGMSVLSGNSVRVELAVPAPGEWLLYVDSTNDLDATMGVEVLDGGQWHPY